jgi:hypothetical protein
VRRTTVCEESEDEKFVAFVIFTFFIFKFNLLFGYIITIIITIIIIIIIIRGSVVG